VGRKSRAVGRPRALAEPVETGKFKRVHPAESERKMSVADIFSAVADIANSVASAAGPVGAVAQVAALAFRAGAAIAKAGKDPVIEIHRLLSPLPQLDGVRAEWNDIIERDFGKSMVPPAPDTLPAAPPINDDIYGDEG
jgi:hypothetical protein